MRKIVKLTESDLSRIVNRIINEQETPNKRFKPYPENLGINTWTTSRLRVIEDLGGVEIVNDSEFQFKDAQGRKWAVTLDWTFNEIGVDDKPEFVDVAGRRKVDNPMFYELFNGRQQI